MPINYGLYCVIFFLPNLHTFFKTIVTSVIECLPCAFSTLHLSTYLRGTTQQYRYSYSSHFMGKLRHRDTKYLALSYKSYKRQSSNLILDSLNHRDHDLYSMAFCVYMSTTLCHCLSLCLSEF